MFDERMVCGVVYVIFDVVCGVVCVMCLMYMCVCVCVWYVV